MPPTVDTFVSYFVPGQQVRIYDLESPYLGEVTTIVGPATHHQQWWRVAGSLRFHHYMDLEPVWT